MFNANVVCCCCSNVPQFLSLHAEPRVTILTTAQSMLRRASLAIVAVELLKQLLTVMLLLSEMVDDVNDFNQYCSIHSMIMLLKF
jgi:hypothetical protein